MADVTPNFSRAVKRRFYLASFLAGSLVLDASLSDAVPHVPPVSPDYNAATAALAVPQARYFKSGVQKLKLRTQLECKPAFDVLPQGLERRFQQRDILAALEFDTLSQKSDYASLDFLAKAAVFGHDGWRICADKVVMAFELSKIVAGKLNNAGMPFVTYGAQKLIGVNVASAVEASPQRIVSDAFDTVLSVQRLPKILSVETVMVYAALQTLPVARIMSHSAPRERQLQFDQSLIDIYAAGDEISAQSLPDGPRRNKSLTPHSLSPQRAPMTDL